MRRQVIAIVLGGLCIALAAVVGAQEGDGTAEKVTEAEAKQMQGQATSAVETMKNLLKEAQNAYNEAVESQNLQAQQAMTDPLALLSSAVKLAQAALVDLGTAMTMRKFEDVKAQYVKIQTYLTKCEGYHGEIMGSTSTSDGGSVDGRPLVEKTVSDEVPDADATEGTTTMSDSSGYVSSVSPFLAEEK